MARDEDGIEQGTGDLMIDAMRDQRLADLADGGQAPLLRVKRAGHLHALEAPAMRMVVIALRRIAQRDALALGAIG